MDAAWAPLLDPAWRRQFGALGHAIDRFHGLEHECECDTCAFLASGLSLPCRGATLPPPAAQHAAPAGAAETASPRT